MLPLTGLREQANPALTIRETLFKTDGGRSWVRFVDSFQTRLKVSGQNRCSVSGFPVWLCTNCDAIVGKIRRRPASAIDIHHHYFPPELIDE
jgi:hypothetical protein